MCEIFDTIVTEPLAYSYDKWPSVTPSASSLLHRHLQIFPSYTQTDVIVIQPLSEAMISTQLALVGFS